MLRIKEPLKLKSLHGIKLLTNTMEEKLFENYKLMQMNINSEKLLHMLLRPPELLFLQEGENSAVYLEIINQLINRMLIFKTEQFTYQDEVYVSAALRKLGIYNSAQFMQNFITMQKEQEHLKQTLCLYSREGHRTAELIRKQEKEQAETFIESNQRLTENRNEYFLQNNIYKRLQTADIYQILYSFQGSEANAPKIAGALNQNNIQRMISGLKSERAVYFNRDHTVKMSEYLRTANMISLTEKSDKIFHHHAPPLYRHMNPYENGSDRLLGIEDRSAENVLQARLGASVLLNLAANLSYLKLGQNAEKAVVWNDVKGLIFQTGETTVKRFQEYEISVFQQVSEYYNVSEAVASRQEKSAERLNQVRSQEQKKLPESLTEIRDEEQKELPESLTEIRDEEQKELPESLTEIRNKEQKELSKRFIEIRNGEQKELSERFIEIRNGEQKELSERFIEIRNEEQKELSERFIEIRNEEQKELSERFIEIRNEEQKELSESFIEIRNEEQKELLERFSEIGNEESRQEFRNAEENKELFYNLTEIKVEDSIKNTKNIIEKKELPEKLLETGNKKTLQRLENKALQKEEEKFLSGIEKEPDLQEGAVNDTEIKKLEAGTKIVTELISPGADKGMTEQYTSQREKLMRLNQTFSEELQETFESDAGKADYAGSEESVSHINYADYANSESDAGRADYAGSGESVSHINYADYANSESDAGRADYAGSGESVSHINYADYANSASDAGRADYVSSGVSVSHINYTDKETFESDAGKTDYAGSGESVSHINHADKETFESDAGKADYAGSEESVSHINYADDTSPESDVSHADYTSSESDVSHADYVSLESYAGNVDYAAEEGSVNHVNYADYTGSEGYENYQNPEAYENHYSKAYSLKEELDLMNDRNKRIHEELEHMRISAEQETAVFISKDRSKKEALLVLENRKEKEDVIESEINQRDIIDISAMEHLQTYKERGANTVLQLADSKTREFYTKILKGDAKSIGLRTTDLSELLFTVREAEKTDISEQVDFPEENNYEHSGLNFIHKNSEMEVDEAQLNAWISRINKKPKQEAEKINILTKETIIKTELSEIKKEILQKSTQEVQELVKKNLHMQMGELTNKIYARLEKKLNNEKKRRGY